MDVHEKPKRPKLWYLISLWLAVAVYCWLAARDLKLPGPHYDEVIQVPVAVHLLNGNLNARYCYWCTTIAGHTFPVMTMPYMGSLETYLYVFSFSILGISIESFRLVNILLAVLALLLTAHFAKTFFGPLAAIAGTWLLATDPSFVILSRLDWGPFVLSLILRLVALICLWHWWKSGGRLLPLLTASAALGLGMYDKANFSWFVVAVPVLGAIVWVSSKERPRLSLKALVAATLVGLITSAPLWVYNVTHNWETFRMVAEPGKSQTLAKFFGEARERTQSLLTMLDSSIFGPRFFEGAVPTHWGLAGTLMLWLSALALLTLSILGCLKRSWQLLLLPLLTVLILCQIFATPLRIWIHHWIGIYPFTQVAIGVVLGLLWNSRPKDWRWRTVGRCSSLAIILLALYFNVVTMASYRQMMFDTGGFWNRSDAIYSLAETLKKEYATRPIHLMNWGIANQLALLSAGDLRLRETFWNYTTSPKPDEYLVNLVRDPANVFVLHAPAVPVRPAARDAFYEAVRQAGVATQAVRKIQDHTGKEVYLLFEFSPSGATTAVSAPTGPVVLTQTPSGR